MTNAVAARADGFPPVRPPPPQPRSHGYAPEPPRLALHGLIRIIPGGGTIYAQEDAARFVYQVASGAVRTVTPRSDGRRVVHGFHLRGEIFGLERGPQYRRWAEAICETRLVQCPRAHIERAAGDDAEMARALRLWLLLDRDQTAERSACLMYGSAFEKLSYFLLELASRTQAPGPLQLPMSRYDIADYLGLSSETVSRTFSVFRNRGLIATRGRQVTLLDDRIRPIDAGAARTPGVRPTSLGWTGSLLARSGTGWPETGDRDHG